MPSRRAVLAATGAAVLTATGAAVGAGAVGYTTDGEAVWTVDAEGESPQTGPVVADGTVFVGVDDDVMAVRA